MHTLTLEFKISGEVAELTAYFDRTGKRDFVSLQLKHKNFVANGVRNVQDCLGHNYDSIIAHILKERDLAALPVNPEPEGINPDAAGFAVLYSSHT